jgi:cyclopropane fatty-acyl-phospholipid synthase-like methyltransferase
MKIGNYEIQVPFVTTASDTVKDLLILLEDKQIHHAVDLGCGDGRVILELGKQGIKTTGYEIKEVLVQRCHQRILQAGLSHVEVFQKDFWDVDLSVFDLIYIYGMTSIMGRLETKLDKEVKKGTIIITNIFKLPHWKVKKEKNYLHLYNKS